MKFMRRADLSPQKRINIALLAMVWQGCYGKMTQIAQVHQISRTFLYQLLATATIHLEVIFSDAYQVLEKASDLPKLILLFRLEGRCSLSSISSILKECHESPNSVGYISEFLQSCGSALPSTLSMKTAKFVFYLSDEIFSIQSPLLVTIDAQSTAILKIEKASDRSAERWREHFLDLEDHLFVTLGMASDRGTGLIKGYEAACERAIWVCDYFHEFRDLFKFVDRLESRAYGTITAQAEAARKFNKARSEANLNKRFEQYEKASGASEKAIDLYDEIFYLTQTLQEILQLCASNGVLKSKTQVKSQLEAVLAMIEELDHVAIKGIVKPLKKHLDDILVPFEQLDKIYAELLESVETKTLEFLTLAWHHEHFSHQTKGKEKRHHCHERDFWLEIAEVQLTKGFPEIQERVFEKMDSVVRASSLVEMVNSIIRNYLNNSKGQITQESLNLIMFYHNHRRYKSGKRKGMAPMELLTGEKLEAHWADLLIQQVKNKEDSKEIISFPKKELQTKDDICEDNETNRLQMAA